MRLIQILHNLMGNALKFTDAGIVSVEIDCHDRCRVAIRVRDTGIGMSEPEIARAFEEFTQGIGGSRRSHVGTGLGLPIVRKPGPADEGRGDADLGRRAGRDRTGRSRTPGPDRRDRKGARCQIPALPAR